MSKEPTLAYTVHHQGRKYLAGTTADEIGPVAEKFGSHVWEGGRGPAKSAPPAPAPAGLSEREASPAAAGGDGEQPSEATSAEATGGEGGARRSPRSGRSPSS